jgi:hypothetical protein
MSVLTVTHRKLFCEVMTENTRRHKNGCLLWIGKFKKTGYPKMARRKAWSEKTYERPSRLLLALRLKRDLEPGEWACHTCDDPRCVEDTHIYLGDAFDNNQDTVARGRRVNHWGKTTPDLVAKIKELRNTGLSQMAIGAKVGVSQIRVSQILLGRPLNAARRRRTH